MSQQKLLLIGAGIAFGVSNIFAISLLGRSESGLPKFNLPVSQYSSYSIDVFKSGETQSYNIKHRMHDPKIVEEVRTIQKPTGFFGKGKSDTYILKQSPVGDEFNQSSIRSSELTAKQIACIEAGGSGKNTGRLVGSAVGTAAAPAFSGVPIIGPFLAGAASMFGMDKGAEIGSQMAKDFKDC
tara:strand:- start:1109 stop:1657 length:549 start_codon:yes stop_codon:yes gene_type:complete